MSGCPPISTGVLTAMALQTPIHAWTRSRHLNPDFREAHKPAFDLGRVVHRMVLEGESQAGMSVLGHADYRSKAAREERDAAYEAGLVPILEHQHKQAAAMFDAVMARLPDMERCSTLGNPAAGEAEVKVGFRHGRVPCRGSIDWLPSADGPDRGFFHDLKTTAASAKPDAWAKQNLFWRGAIQAAYYRYALMKDRGETRTPLFVVVEKEPPHETSVVAVPEPALLAVEGMVVQALDAYERCCETGEWPGYSRRIQMPDMTPWQIAEAEAMGGMPDEQE